MSQILDRMVRRTRAPLAAVEPLYPSRFSAASSSGVLSGNIAAPQEFYADAQPGESAAGWSLQGAGDSPATEFPVTRAVDTQSAHNGEHVGTSGATAPQVLQRQTIPQAIAAPARSHAEHGMTSLSAASPLPVELRTQRTAASSEPRSMDDGFPHTWLGDPIKSTTSRAARSDHRTMNTAPAIKRTAGANAGAASEPVVTISIGHIELHAAQATERPRRPVFKPKLSLNDFLNRAQGGTRE